ncbi:MAG: glutamine amidotransferase family protein [bacterium]
MNKPSFTTPPSGTDQLFDACGIAAFINIDGKMTDGRKIISMITTMKDRENGLGAGYALYGLFPDQADLYCIQLILDDPESRERIRDYLKTRVKLVKDEEIHTQKTDGIAQPYPLMWRFFVDPDQKESEEDYMVKLVMEINAAIEGAYCMSSGKNMAVFKGNGWSDDIAEFYNLQEYKSHMWLSHSRFPTNTPGWWGGAHPFNILSTAVVHNGEITSYGTNKRYLEMWKYKCALMTDSEVVTYLFDLLTRKHKLPPYIACLALAPPYYHNIEEMEDEGERRLYQNLRRVYGPAMLNGPFSICVGNNTPTHSLIGLTDRKKLRPLIAAGSKDGNTVYLSSEECAIRVIGDEIGEVWAPNSGNPVIVEQGKGLIWKGTEEHLGNKKVIVN